MSEEKKASEEASEEKTPAQKLREEKQKHADAFAAEYRELCAKYGMQISFAPQLIEYSPERQK